MNGSFGCGFASQKAHCRMVVPAGDTGWSVHTEVGVRASTKPLTVILASFRHLASQHASPTDSHAMRLGGCRQQLHDLGKFLSGV
jgi:hypothetical protein